MRQKSSLSLMELAVMVAVFALAAAICLRAFVWADSHSRRSQAESRAVLLCQSAAEAIQAASGDGEDRLSAAARALDIPYGAFAQEGYAFEGHYDADFQPCDSRDYSYCLRARTVDSGLPGLGKALVTVTGGARQDTLFSLEVCWQEEIRWEVDDDA